MTVNNLPKFLILLVGLLCFIPAYVAKQKAKQAVLDKLGINANEAALLLG